ncbi:hypothetical protein QFZ74_002516 [Streptomyces sp. V3I7]|nr:hypothetical protein [Streptomyces sp. V3I7]
MIAGADFRNARKVRGEEPAKPDDGAVRGDEVVCSKGA